MGDCILGSAEQDAVNIAAERACRELGPDMTRRVDVFDSELDYPTGQDRIIKQKIWNETIDRWRDDQNRDGTK